MSARLQSVVVRGLAPGETCTRVEREQRQRASALHLVLVCVDETATIESIWEAA